jgi:2-polyprenyl-3-methyl-5-hydroxy-6-metoxy-1,4-benzoquinol methylase
MNIRDIVDWSTLIIQSGLAIFMFYMMAAFFTGAPLVGTRKRMIEKILAEGHLKAGQKFLDLGSGDGRMLEAATKKYHVTGTGIEMNFLLVWYTRLKAGLTGLEIKYICGNFWKQDLKSYNVIYAYLFPDTMEKLKKIFEHNNVKGQLIISRIFEIKGWEKKLVNKIPDGDGWVYYYRV